MQGGADGGGVEGRHRYNRARLLPRATSMPRRAERRQQRQRHRGLAGAGMRRGDDESARVMISLIARPRSGTSVV